MGGADTPPASLRNCLGFLDASEGVFQGFPDSEIEQQHPPHTFLSKNVLGGGAGPWGSNITAPD